jgi:hypothetical protein
MKTKTISILSLFVMFSLCNCSADQKSRNSEIGIESINFKMDTLLLNIPDDYLVVPGMLRIVNDELTFFDYHNLHASIFDQNGAFITYKLGFGEGPNQVQQYDYHGIIPDTEENLFFASSYHIYRFSKDLLTREQLSFFSWGERKKTYDSPDLSNINLYDFHHEWPKHHTKSLTVINEEQFIIPLNISWRVSPELNRLDHPEQYFNEAYPLGIYNLEKGILESGFGNFPDDYNKLKYVQALSHASTSISGGKIFVSYMASPTIQQYNTKGDLVKEFGEAVDGIKNDYPMTKNRKEFFQSARSIFNEYGYYSHIYADEDLIFRTVISGYGYSWLQIYQGKQLLKTVKVPERFNVIGKMGDWYYADGVIDEEENKLGFYKFKI